MFFHASALHCNYKSFLNKFTIDAEHIVHIFSTHGRWVLGQGRLLEKIMKRTQLHLTELPKLAVEEEEAHLVVKVQYSS